MKANTTAIHARLYKFTYSGKLPDNLCPYFWKVLGALILFIPNFLLQLPAIILGRTDKISKEDPETNMIIGGLVWGLILIAYGFLTLQYHLIKYLFHCYSYNSAKATVGSLIDCGIIFSVACVYVKHLIDTRRGEKAYKENRPNLLTEFIKAKYHRYCPKIDWE